MSFDPVSYLMGQKAGGGGSQSYEDFSTMFDILQYEGVDRCKLSTVIARKYSNGRVSIYLAGTVNAALPSTSWSLMRVQAAAGVTPPSYTAGTGTYNNMPCFSRIDTSDSPYIELAHNGTTAGKQFEILLEYWLV